MRLFYRFQDGENRRLSKQCLLDSGLNLCFFDELVGFILVIHVSFGVTNLGLSLRPAIKSQVYPLKVKGEPIKNKAFRLSLVCLAIGF